MKSTGLKKEPEVAMIEADSQPVDGWKIHWLISKNQIEYILRDIASVPPSPEAPHVQRAQYQDEVLPVLNLEEHFGLTPRTENSQHNYLVTKMVLPAGGLAKSVLKLSNPIRIRALSFNATEAQHTGLEENEEDILGAFTLPDNQLVIVPDIAAIMKKES